MICEWQLGGNLEGLAILFVASPALLVIIICPILWFLVIGAPLVGWRKEKTVITSAILSIFSSVAVVLIWIFGLGPFPTWLPILVLVLLILPPVILYCWPKRLWVFPAKKKIGYKNARKMVVDKVNTSNLRVQSQKLILLKGRETWIFIIGGIEDELQTIYLDIESGEISNASKVP
jgi:hypothetical protein